MEIGIRLGDLATLILYFAVTIGIGVWCSTRLKSTENYFVGGRSIPGWAVGISMLGTAISSVTFLAYPGTAFEGNWSLLVPGLMLPIAAVIAIYFFVPYYRRANLVSVNQYLERRFGAWARVYGCIMWSLYSFIRMGIILFLLALPVKAMTGWDTYSVIVVLGILVTVYTLMGGIEAVIWTDVIQTIILFLGGIVCILIVWFDVPGGMSTIFSEAIAARKFDLAVDNSFSFVRETIWVLLLYGLVQNLQEFASDQTKVQRYCAANSDKAARKAVWIGGLGCIPIWVTFMFVGTCLYVFYQNFPDAMKDGLLKDEVFPHFILTQLPVGVAGFVIAAVLAAAMSSIDSSLNGTATVLTTDIYRRFLVTGKEDRHYLNAARWITGLAGVGMILFSLFVAYIVHNGIFKQEAVLNLVFFFYSVLAGGIGGLFFLGFMSKRANSQGVAIGIILALIVTFYMTFSVLDWLPKAYASPFHKFTVNGFSNVVSFIVGYFASYLFARPRQDQLENLTWWTFQKES